jgi:hypothetical protein
VLKYPIALLLVSSLWALSACSRGETPEHAAEGEPGRAHAQGDDSALDHVRAGVHALTQPEPSVEYVAAEMEGVIMARTKSQALMHYDGYRATLTTPGDRVTRIKFDLIEAKPTIKQLTGVFGEPEEVRKGMLYEYVSAATGATIVILAEPVSMPADEGSLVRRIIIEGARKR